MCTGKINHNIVANTYTHIHKERERERGRERLTAISPLHTIEADTVGII
jgi:hypothetical protein